MRMSEFSVPKRNFASVFASFVFPTPVGPKNINDPIGLLELEIPALFLLTALEISFIASSCQTTVL